MVALQEFEMGRQTPDTGHALRLRARSGLFLSVAIVVWLSIMIIPCTVLAAGDLGSEPPATEAAPPDCHGMHLEDHAASATDCCCDPLTVTGAETQKPQRAELVAASPLIDLLVVAPLVSVAPDRAHPRPPIDIGPPVYLATKRFRI